MRRAIEITLNSEYEIVASVEDGEGAVTAATTLSPQLILLDISMPGLNGFEAARRIKLVCPAILLIFISNHDEASYIQAAFDAGGSGYVPKRSMVSELLPAIREVLIGKEYGRGTAWDSLRDC